ncbi:MAG TPA: serine/threonine-protein kinase [Dehalococcoidia bacterium]|nr:serine/threonine-protein kinase [Dehalococcoidia bacterium]
MVIPADTVFGQYRIIAPAGQGGMTQTYRAATTGQGGAPAEVTLKTIAPALSTQPDFAARFAREAAALAALRHPNILPVIDYGQAEGRAYLVYPALPGGTLRQRLGRPIPPEQAQALLVPVAAALDAAHQNGVVHGNLKPRNILLAANGAPLLDDFGLTHLVEPDGAGPGGATLGTPAYMAPEQVQGRPLDGRVDQYALGIIAYQMLTGSVPFSGADPEAVAWMHVRDPLPPPSSRNPALAGPIEQVLLVALSREPAGRFPSCGSFISALGQALRAAPQPSPITPNRRGEGVPPQPAGATAPTLIDVPGASGALPPSPAGMPPPMPVAPYGGMPQVAAAAGPFAGAGAAGGVQPLWALAGGVGFVLAIVATLLPWVTVPRSEGKHYVNGWYPRVPFQIDDWLSNRHAGRTDAVVLLLLCLLGLALVAGLLANRRGGALAFVAAALGAVVALIGVLEVHYIGLRTADGEGLGFGVWLLIAGGALALAGALIEGVRRQGGG